MISLLVVMLGIALFLLVFGLIHNLIYERRWERSKRGRVMTSSPPMWEVSRRTDNPPPSSVPTVPPVSRQYYWHPTEDREPVNIINPMIVPVPVTVPVVVENHGNSSWDYHDRWRDSPSSHCDEPVSSGGVRGDSDVSSSPVYDGPMCSASDAVTSLYDSGGSSYDSGGSSYDSGGSCSVDTSSSFSSDM